MHNSFNRPVIRYFAMWMIFGAVVFVIMVFLAAGGSPNLDSISGGLILQLLAFLPLIWFLWKHLSLNLPVQYFFNKRLLPFRLWILMLLWLLILLCSYGLDGLSLITLSQFYPEYVNEAISEPIFPDGQSGSIHVLTFMLAVIVGPLMEELVFRGLLLERLAKKFGLNKAVLTSSVLFGMLHGETLLTAIIFGIAMCIVYLQTKNLWVPVFIHIANNLFAVIWAALEPSSFSYSEPDDLVEMWPSFLITSLAIVGVVLILKKFWPPKEIDLPYSYNYEVRSGDAH